MLEKQHIKSARQFALRLDTPPQNFHEILKLRRDISIELLQKAVEVFQMNPQYLLSGQGPMFLQPDHSQDFKVLTIVADREGKESIVHVPVQAQAGYPGGFYDPEYVNELPRYNLPNLKFCSESTMRSFEVNGDSMKPVLSASDIIICSYLHSYYWEKQLTDGPLFVIVTNEDVLVKRVTNLLRTEQKLLLHSDNEDFVSYAVHIKDIKEIWKVRAKISTKLDKTLSSNPDKIQDIHHLLEKQTKMIQSILSKE